MRAAVYYPHTTIRNEELLKSALLMWDRVEFISPWPGFRPSYPSRAIAEAMELVGLAHVPTDIQKREAHQHILEMIETKVPPEFVLRNRRKADHYEVYPEKLLPETWQELRRASMSGKLRASGDYPLMEPAGLTVMSILADCCAGATKARITDRGDAYATVSKLLTVDDVDDLDPNGEERGIVPFKLQIAGLDKVSLDQLVAFRRREEVERSNDLRDLRHRYVDRISDYVARIRTVAKRPSDVDELRRQYTDDMDHDLHALRTELGMAKRDILLSKDVVAPVVGVVGFLAGLLGGGTVPMPELFTVGGAAVAIGGGFGAANKYAVARRSILQKHPVAYLYELQDYYR